MISNGQSSLRTVVLHSGGEETDLHVGEKAVDVTNILMSQLHHQGLIMFHQPNPYKIKPDKRFWKRRMNVTTGGRPPVSVSAQIT